MLISIIAVVSGLLLIVGRGTRRNKVPTSQQNVNVNNNRTKRIRRKSKNIRHRIKHKKVLEVWNDNGTAFDFSKKNNRKRRQPDKGRYYIPLVHNKLTDKAVVATITSIKHNDKPKRVKDGKIKKVESLKKTEVKGHQFGKRSGVCPDVVVLDKYSNSKKTSTHNGTLTASATNKVKKHVDSSTKNKCIIQSVKNPAPTTNKIKNNKKDTR